ncbi:MAG: DUF1697 domain-containing protein [Euryarchaeota archaeon]|nr:DUF1697 domain-containing protein [Euryarchaeota archaeon]MDE1835810.1 DUF1697 domain-containing protein [Euryarchaeota archaeon]MDE1880716.1 DUF1697 domain-containing protein [Euryarchaeota archaeon]MDE2044001.1 DUF1697 domain-containing protein [Thermoplasmata archaeon]
MPRYAALLRSVNVGKRSLSMKELQSVGEEIGLGEVRTLLRTGNLLFSSPERNVPKLQRALEEKTHARTGLRTTVFVRSAAAWSEIVRSNPFEEYAREDPSHLVVVLLKKGTTPGALEGLRRSLQGRETVQLGSESVYATYPDGLGRSWLTLDRIERALGAAGTARNWNTVLRIQRVLADGR